MRTFVTGRAPNTAGSAPCRPCGSPRLPGCPAGRPLAFGKVAGAAFIGLPGNPVSSFVTFLIFVRPFVLKTQGVSATKPRIVEARADFDWPKPDARREFLRVKWNASGGLDLYPTQDSAVLTSTAWADGLVDNPPNQAIAKGDQVRLLPYSELYR